ncbi:hypothetical protein ACIPWF_22950 [Paenarthrobacter sp. NPDC089989]|uniref:hypothetical protein n=1 Tax=unclassified Paenarthrobacter TaxID=2634190 RepID=UPI0038221278
MTLNELLARLRAGHLMVRSAREWDDLATELSGAYEAGDEELIEQLRPPFLQSWRTVTRYVLRDDFDAAGISVSDPSSAWGIAVLESGGRMIEPLLSPPSQRVGESLEALDGFTVLGYEETLAGYAHDLGRLFAADEALSVTTSPAA